MDREAEKKLVEQKVEEFSAKLQEAKLEIAKKVWGQEDVIDLTLACMVAGGHLLAEGVPGLAKTLLVSNISTIMGLDWKRIQCTPDLMPSDILGTELLDEDENGKRHFRFVEGPVFTQFLLADEINRTPPRTQSALLEAMQDRKVTVAGKTYTLKRPFTVMATQNPLEQEGTYPLPEAQLDRFMMKVNVTYPDAGSEKRIMRETTRTNDNLVELFNESAKGADLTIAPDKVKVSKALLGQNDLILMQKVAGSLSLPEGAVEAAAKIIRGMRPNDPSAPAIVKENVEFGPGPRAYQAFAQVARARALMRGDLAASVDDIIAVVDPVLKHRMGISFAAQHSGGVTFEEIKSELVRSLKL